MIKQTFTFLVVNYASPGPSSTQGQGSEVGAVGPTQVRRRGSRAPLPGKVCICMFLQGLEELSSHPTLLNSLPKIDLKCQ